MSIFTQVFDSNYGTSATGIRAYLDRRSGAGWTTIAEAETDANGQIDDWHGPRLGHGLYRIVFDSDSYFAALGARSAYPEVIVVLRMQNEAEAFQVQLTLAPYSYAIFFHTVEDRHMDREKWNTAR
jgi:5-hydroxyisourate hydrolase